MSCLKLCDGDDCYQSENDSQIIHIDHETKKFLYEHCSSWFNSNLDDICMDCIDQANMDYPNFFILNEYHNLSIGKKYIDNPQALEG